MTDTAIIVEKTLPYPPQKIWRILTQPEMIAQWLMPNDFQPVLGHKFRFHTQPMGKWDGVVDCEVLEIEEARLLRISWVGGSDDNENYGSRLVSELTWTLTPVDGGTHVRMEHSGFGPNNAFAFQAMGQGWNKVLDSIDRLAATV
jgi:uncharacterized protein YndB with AHSA1/START domain